MSSTKDFDFSVNPVTTNEIRVHFLSRKKVFSKASGTADRQEEGGDTKQANFQLSLAVPQKN